MATNEQMLVSAFQETAFIRSSLIWQIFSAMSANDPIPFGDQTLKNGRLAVILNLSNFVIFRRLKQMQNSWTMNIKQNGRSHTMITNDKFRTNKIQNGHQSALSILFPQYLGNLAL